MADKKPNIPLNLPDKIRDTMNKLGFPRKSREATSWLMDKYKQLHIGTNNIMKPGTMGWTDFKGSVEIGKMYFFSYDPKHKETLPFYDRFPLIIAVDHLHDGFYGINLHYLPPNSRLGLLAKLETITNNTKWDNSTKMNISYQLLSSASKFAEFRPCFKRYLRSHVQSSFLYIPPSQWELSIFLPAERFVKKNRNQIWYNR